jgi:two-component system nitrogen regulation response regulator NtrX
VLFGRENDQGVVTVGILEQAHGGTLFLDEVADMPPAVQSKLLQLLQHNRFERVGGTKKIEVDVRVISSTSKDLQQAIADGCFREDLYYRLNVVGLSVPALSERRGDIKALVNHFVGQCARSLGQSVKKVSDDAMAILESYQWPGNVRQLKNVIEWVLIMAPDDCESIAADMLPPEVVSSNQLIEHPDNNADLLSMPLKAAREIFETQYLTAQLRRFGGNVSRTAEFVGMERSAFHRKLKQLNIGEQKKADQGE